MVISGGTDGISVRWNTLQGGPRGGPGEPPDAREFSKICKRFLKKIEKFIILAYFTNGF